jgi:DNA polymerase-3 subunit beta
MQILNNALLEATEDGELHIHATDLDVSLSSTIPAEVTVAGKTSIRAKDLHDIVKGLKTEKLSLEKDGQQSVKLTAGTVEARLVAMNPEEFPKRQETGDIEFSVVPTKKFMRLVNRVIFSISTDDTRPNLTGALVHSKGKNRLELVSTDGHRLSMASTELPEGVSLPDDFDEGIIVPKKGLSELRRITDLTIEELEVGLQGQNIVFRHDNSTLYIRAIDGKFPSFSQVIPEEHEDRKAIVHRKTLIDRVGLVSNFASSRTRSIRLALEDGNCTISAEDPDKGECVEQIPVAYSAPAVKAGFNFNYLVDVLRTVEGEEISLEMTDTLSPTVVHELEPEEGEESLFIVMPMRL